MKLLGTKEMQIMNLFWELDRPCVISDLLNADSTLNRNTAAKLLVALDKKGYIKVHSIRRTITRTGRAYVPTMTREDYERKYSVVNALADRNDLSKNAMTFMSAFLQTDSLSDDLIEELDSIIQKYADKEA